MNESTGFKSGAATQQLRRRRSLHSELVEILRQMVLEGQLAPGTRVPEAAICEELEVSRTPLREALKVLAAEGLVVLLPNRGCMIAEVSAEDVAAAFTVLGTLETLIGELAVARATDDDLKNLTAMHEEMVELHAAGRMPEYFQRNQQIHVALAVLSGNPILIDIYESLLRKIMRARAVANLDRLRWEESLQEHIAFMQALTNRDGRRLATFLKKHNDRTGTAVVAKLEEIQRDANSKESA